jgi:hypothetical protein
MTIAGVTDGPAADAAGAADAAAGEARRAAGTDRTVKEGSFGRPAGSGHVK